MSKQDNLITFLLAAGAPLLGITVWLVFGIIQLIWPGFIEAVGAFAFWCPLWCGFAVEDLLMLSGVVACCILSGRWEE